MFAYEKACLNTVYTHHISFTEAASTTSTSVNMKSVFIITIAFGKSVALSSVYQLKATGEFLIGHFAVDGVYRPPADNERLSIAHTRNEVNPWLRVDLEQVHCIWAVRVLNRGDSPARDVYERLRDVIVTVSILEDQLFYSNNPDSLCGQREGILDQFFTTITCAQAMKAQFVQLQLMGHTNLNIYEFEVHGFANK
ncbi:fucolectin-1-like [Watersipora subatra]|uniref:fucolectin-1-like n=1 Tax=Watersipora subatra TaxID=2589382 RepID=UPI00355BE2F7